MIEERVKLFNVFILGLCFCLVFTGFITVGQTQVTKCGLDGSNLKALKAYCRPLSTALQRIWQLPTTRLYSKLMASFYRVIHNICDYKYLGGKSNVPLQLTVILSKISYTPFFRNSVRGVCPGVLDLPLGGGHHRAQALHDRRQPRLRLPDLPVPLPQHHLRLCRIRPHWHRGSCIVDCTGEKLERIF